MNIKQGLFINPTKAACSIYESGMMIYNIISKVTKIDLDIMSISRSDAMTGNFKIPEFYDFYLFNWHHWAMPVSKEKIDKLPGKKLSILLEISPSSVFDYAHDDWFDFYMAIDPTKLKDKNVYIFSRPIEIMRKSRPLLDKLSFGSFGLHIPGKRFEDIVKVATDLNEDCIVRINICQGTYVGNQQIKQHFDVWRKLAGPKVDLRLTDTFMDKQELISWCSEHTLNVFPYYRTAPGLAATTDQAISSGRALAVTYCDTFRHIHKYIDYFPNQSYLELIKSTPSGVRQMQQDWSQEVFLNSFEDMFTEEGLI